MAYASARYAVLSTPRSSPLERARDAAKLTIPGLIPQEGQDEHTVLEQPYQSVGVHGVTNLTSRGLLALFPPNVPFYRLAVDADTAKQLGTQLGEANTRLSDMGGVVYAMFEGQVSRAVLNMALTHLVVGGNALLYQPADGPTRMFRLDQYVVQRRHSGEFKEIIVREQVFPSVLSDEVRQATGLTETTDEKPVELFTVVQRRGSNVVHWQEIKGVEVPGSRGQAPAESCGWLPLRWEAVPGSDYGRGQVTKYIGDLLSLEDLSQSMVEFAKVAAQIIRIVDPNSGLDVEELANARSGDWLTGYADRVQTLGLDKGQDWQVMNALASRLEDRLSNAFLLRSSAIRNSERTTAEEVRMVAEELETILGGTYTLLSSELQLPLVRRFLYLGARSGRVPKLPKSIAVRVVTGFDALGRTAEVNRLRDALADLTAALGPGAVERYVNGEEVTKRIFEGRNVEGIADLLKTSEQLEADQQNAATAQAGQAAAPALAKAGVEAMAQPQQDIE
ncbi:portal protein [Caulobacter sp.]|uniref:portal protein n=1 Tax=Caulobacter sp. TaxID=78 RepID=UPI0031D6E60E